MKINPINNTKFKGHFIDMSAQNNGNWKMVYHPYSWESGMHIKEKIDIKKDLPLNEEIYIPQIGNEPEISKDILGTVSYYKYPEHINNGKTRRHIDIGQSYNREDSLIVLRKKLDVFRKMKIQACKDIAEKIQKARIGMLFPLEDYNNSSKAHRDSFFGTKSHDAMDESVKKIDRFFMDTLSDAKDYIEISESLNNLESKYRNITKELEDIRIAKGTGNLIDISENNSGTFEYLHSLLDKIHNKEIPIANVDKYLVLTHESGSFKEIADRIVRRMYGSYIPKDYKLETFEPKYIIECIKRYIHR